jgi:hypothetical protein
MSQLDAELIDELSENLAEDIDDQFFQGRDPIVIIRLLIVQNFLGEDAIQRLIEDLTIGLHLDYSRSAFF